MPTTPKQPLSGDFVALEKKLRFKELELNALLEVTQSINANLPEEDLYKIFHFTLIVNLSIKKLAFYVHDPEWTCKVCFGTKSNFKQVNIGKELLELKEITELKGRFSGFEEFDLVLPIAHKGTVLAFVFVGGGENYKAETDVPFIRTLASIITVAIENKKLARKELQQEALRKELQIASDVQAHLFPKSFPKNESFSVHACYLPHLVVGGDYYDFIKIDEDKYLMCIADVSGKGIPAALLMSNFQASLRTLVRQTSDLSKIISELNFVISRNSQGERFITFFAAIYDNKKRTINYINAGHNPPVFLTSDNKVKTLDKGTTILGIFEKLPDIEEEEFEVPPQSLLFTYTDGLSEASNEQEEEYGLERLEQFLIGHRGKELAHVHEALLADINRFKGKRSFSDDITIISAYFN